MNCRQMAELLLDFLNDELPDDQRRLLEEHLCDCPPCVTYVATYRATVRIAGRLPDVPVPPQVLARLRAALGDLGDCRPPRG